MAFGDILLSLFIVSIFVGLYAYNFFSIGVKQIQDNWPEYRCNPMYMPFSQQFGQDPMQNFTYCIQDMTKNLMAHLMEPLNHSVSLLSKLGGGFTKSIDGVRKMFSHIRESISGVIKNIFGIFLSILIEIQRMIMNIKDIMGKTVGMMTTVMFLIDGTVKTMESAWKGPPGGMVRALCFEPNTLIQLENKEYRKIKDLHLGDVLKGGSVVEATLNLRNEGPDGKPVEALYELPGGEKSQKILVSGKHFVLGSNGFVHAKDHPDARLSLSNSHTLNCLITSDNRIRIGNQTFWDWEDDILTNSYSLRSNLTNCGIASRILNNIITI